MDRPVHNGTDPAVIHYLHPTNAYTRFVLLIVLTLVLTTSNCESSVDDSTGSSQLPYEGLVELMDNNLAPRA